jgi:membrane protein insertase Oxa1/YidC/SpoIIIJ
MPSVPASYRVRHECKSLSQHGAYGSSQKRQRPYPQKLCHRIPQFPSLFQHHHPRSRPVLQFLIPRRLQRLFPPRPSRHLPLYPNPTPLTLSQRSRPLQYGDLAALGLAGWSPAGLSSWMLEIINVLTGLPWFHTVIAGTLFSRLLLLPFSIKQLRNSSALAPHSITTEDKIT